MIVIAGQLAELQEELLAGIRSVVYRRALPLATRSVRIETSVAGPSAAAVGASILIHEHLLSPEGIGQLLSRPAVSDALLHAKSKNPVAEVGERS